MQSRQKTFTLGKIKSENDNTNIRREREALPFLTLNSFFQQAFSCAHASSSLLGARESKMNKPMVPHHNLEGKTDMVTRNKLPCRGRAMQTKAQSIKATCSERFMAIVSFSSTWLSCPLRLLQSKAWLRHWIFEKVSLKNMLTIHSSSSISFGALFLRWGQSPLLDHDSPGSQDKLPLDYLSSLCLLNFSSSRVVKDMII